MQAEEQIPENPTVVHKAGWLALVGLLLIVAGAASYMPLLQHAFLRNTGALVWAFMGISLVLSAVAFTRDRRMWVRAVSCFNALLVAFSLASFFVLATLPDEATFAALEEAPDFRLEDHTGQTVSLADSIAAGPVLLVFYRGHW